MAETSIEWTERTWNPIVGCSVLSPGCTNCYAMKMAARLERMGQDRYVGLTKPTKAGPVWTGELRLVEDALTLPLRRRKPTTWFVNSMSDLFHESVPDVWIDRVFAVMALAPQHTFQVLTKRSARMRAYLTQLDEEPARDTCRRITLAWPGRTPIPEGGITFPLANVWLGVSAEDQRRADKRIPDLLATPAAVRFVSAEPLLGPIDFAEWIERIEHCGGCGAESGPTEEDRCPKCGAENVLITTWGEEQAERYRNGDRYDEDNAAGRADIEGTSPTIDWLIVGGESGPNARPMHPQWARDIRDQCAAAGVAFHFKQHGAWISVPDLRRLPGGSGPGFGAFDHCRHDMEAECVRVGKKAAGRLLDGVEHNGMPDTPRPALSTGRG